MLQGKQQTIACAILRRRHPRPVSLALPAIADEVLNPFQARAPHPTVPLLFGRRHIVEGLPPVVIDQSCTIRCAVSDRPLWIAPGSTTDRANPGAAEQLNPRYNPGLH